MTKLCIYSHLESPTLELKTDLPLEISELLDDVGITYRKLDVSLKKVHAVIDDENMSQMHCELVKDVPLEHLTSCSTVVLDESFPNHDHVRLKYLSEHTLDQEEAYLVLEGKCLVSLNLDKKVIQLECEKGDFIDIPSNFRHWIDFGVKGRFSAVKCTEQEEMAAICYTGSHIADRFPRLV